MWMIVKHAWAWLGEDSWVNGFGKEIVLIQTALISRTFARGAFLGPHFTNPSRSHMLWSSKFSLKIWMNHLAIYAHVGCILLCLFIRLQYIELVPCSTNKHTWRVFSSCLLSRVDSKWQCCKKLRHILTLGPASWIRHHFPNGIGDDDPPKVGDLSQGNRRLISHTEWLLIKLTYPFQTL